MNRGLLALDTVTARLGGFTLGPVSLELPSGALCAVVGASGSGKSALLQTIAGLVPVSSGTIAVDGRDLTRIPPEERGIAIVPQHYALFPHLSVQENVAFGLRARGVPAPRAREEARAALDRLEIGHLADRRPATLSGGERQRTAIARAVVLRERLILLDEPFAALDPVNRAISIEELQAIHAALGLTVVLVTHRPDEAELLGTHVAVVVGGRLAAFGEASEVFSNPPDERAVRALGLENLFPGGSVPGFAGPGPWYVPASSVSIRPAAVGQAPEGRVVLEGVVDRVQRVGPLRRVRIHGDGYRVTGYSEGGMPGIGARALALFDPAAARGVPAAGHPPSPESPCSPPAQGRVGGSRRM
ncbi:MAG: ABC transporter ATP-binding protein [Methanospirillum sp.]|nr:ABC transporter ATP-binding protein [Methanospirillum sp.]